MFEDVEILDQGSRHRRRPPGTETTVGYGYEPSISFATHTARPGRHLGVIDVTGRCRRDPLVSFSCHASFATALDPVGVSALFCVSHSPEAMKFNAIGNASLKVSHRLSTGQPGDEVAGEVGAESRALSSEEEPCILQRSSTSMLPAGVIVLTGPSSVSRQELCFGVFAISPRKCRPQNSGGNKSLISSDISTGGGQCGHTGKHHMSHRRWRWTPERMVDPWLVRVDALYMMK